MAENINISPDMINNLVNMLKNNGFSRASESTQSTNYNNSNEFSNQPSQSTASFETADSAQSDFNADSSNSDSSKANSSNTHNFETGNSNSDSSSVNNSSSFNGIDFETLMKMKSIMETLNNSNDQDSKLLYSLKPYLRKSRQAKLDQYINILKITQVSKFFNARSENK